MLCRASSAHLAAHLVRHTERAAVARVPQLPRARPVQALSRRVHFGPTALDGHLPCLAEAAEAAQDVQGGTKAILSEHMALLRDGHVIRPEPFHTLNQPSTIVNCE